MYTTTGASLAVHVDPKSLFKRGRADVARHASIKRTLNPRLPS
jgi:hypothetical protein